MENLERKSEWVYICDERFPENEQIIGVRYVLGEIFDRAKTRALICIGINPSTAIPEHLDATLNRVSKHAKESGEYGAWYMLNVYPQRSTDPNGMHPNDKFSTQIHERNLSEIKALLDIISSADVWCAWGTNINKRRYLPDMLYGNKEKGVSGLLSLFGDNYTLKARAVTKNGHPAHPLARISLSRLRELESFPNLDDRLKQTISNE